MIVGFSASLRNARFGRGSAELEKQIERLADYDEMLEFVLEQVKVRAEDFNAISGDFQDKLKWLKENKYDQGLSNSETGLVASLWGASQAGQQIKHVSLHSHFDMSGNVRENKKSELLEILNSCAGVIVSTPVYFGDRSSLAQNLFDFLSDLSKSGKLNCSMVYGGVSVGAKRNGGQETTLVYQLMDAVNLGLYGVGNGAETTAQYGGTLVAGDVGMAASDKYGIKTAYSLGKRVGEIANIISRDENVERRGRLEAKPRVGVIILSDNDQGKARGYVQKRLGKILPRSSYETSYLDVSSSSVLRCIACDLCPTEVGDIEEYRCIITADKDLFSNTHSSFLDYDCIIPVFLSDGSGKNGVTSSTYQRFMERSRYLRRDEYVFANTLIAPWILKDIDSNDLIDVRMSTSFLRHNTILTKQIITLEFENCVINSQQEENALKNVKSKLDKLFGAGVRSNRVLENKIYDPVGYKISKEKKSIDLDAGLVHQKIASRGKPE